MTSHEPSTDASEAPGTCESCGAAGEELTLVRRVYVTPESWDTDGRVDVAGLEWWCFLCRTHYPHQDPDAPPDSPA
jgi:hypothetical protein